MFVLFCDLLFCSKKGKMKKLKRKKKDNGSVYVSKLLLNEPRIANVRLFILHKFNSHSPVAK